MNKKLALMPYANAKVWIDGFNNVTLISYSTTVANVIGNRLHIFGLYSATTRRHLDAFVKEYCGIDYQTAKWLYENSYDLDWETGELYGG